MNSHERAFIENFLYAPRRERFLEGLESPQKRKSLLEGFCHPSWSNFLAPGYASSVAPSENKPASIATRLRNLGAPRKCHVIGEHLDGQEVSLDEALLRVVGRACGVVLSCIPGQRLS
jgi:hypothetical protein